MHQSLGQPGPGDDGPPTSETVAPPDRPETGPVPSGPGPAEPVAVGHDIPPVEGAAGGGNPMRPTGPPGERKGAVKRERILRAATELFATRAFHRVLMDDVARGAGVGKGTLYRYFATKEDLFVAALSHAVDVTAERLRARLEKLDDPVKQLRLACMQALHFFRGNDHLFRVLHHRKALGSEEARAELNEKRRALRLFAEGIIIEGRESGVFDVEDPGFASTILWGMIRTALRSAPDKGSLDELAGKITDLFINGIAKC